MATRRIPDAMHPELFEELVSVLIGGFEALREISESSPTGDLLWEGEYWARPSAELRAIARRHETFLRAEAKRRGLDGVYYLDVNP